MGDRKNQPVKRITKQALKKNTEFIALGTKANSRSAEKTFNYEFLRKNEIPKKFKLDTSPVKNLTPLEVMNEIDLNIFSGSKDFVISCIKNLLIQNDLNYLLPVIYSAKLNPSIFADKEVLPLMRDLIKADVPDSELITVAVINILLWSFNDLKEWPVFIMELFLDDFLSDDRWCDHNQCQAMAANLLATFMPIHHFFQPSITNDVVNSCPFMDYFHFKLNFLTPFNRFSSISAQIGDLVAATLTKNARDSSPNLLKLAGLTAMFDSVKLFVSYRLEQWIQNPKLSALAFEVFNACCFTKWQNKASGDLHDFLRNIIKSRPKIKQQVFLIENSFKNFLLVNIDSFDFITDFIIEAEIFSFRTLSVHLLNSCLLLCSDQAFSCLVSAIFSLFSSNSRSFVVNFVRDLLRLEPFCSSFSVFHSKLLLKFSDFDVVATLANNFKEKFFNSVVDITCIALIVFTVTNIPDYPPVVSSIQESALEWLKSVVFSLCSSSMSSAFIIWLKRLMCYEEISELIPRDLVSETLTLEDIVRRVKMSILSEKSVECLFSIASMSSTSFESSIVTEMLIDYFLTTAIERLQSRGSSENASTVIHTDNVYGGKIDGLVSYDVMKLISTLLGDNVNPPGCWNIWLLGFILSLFYCEQPLLIVDSFPALSFLVELVILGPDLTENISVEETTTSDLEDKCDTHVAHLSELSKQNPPQTFIEKLSLLNKTHHLDYYVIKLDNYSFFVNFLRKNKNLEMAYKSIEKVGKINPELYDVLDTSLLINHLCFKVKNSKFDRCGLNLLVALNARCNDNTLMENFGGFFSSLSDYDKIARLKSISILDMIFEVNFHPEKGCFLSKIASNESFVNCIPQILNHFFAALNVESDLFMVEKYLTFVTKSVNLSENDINTLSDWLISRHVVFDFPTNIHMLTILSDFYVTLLREKSAVFNNHSSLLAVVMLSCHFPEFKQLLNEESISGCLASLKFPEWLAIKVLVSQVDLEVLNLNALESINAETCTLITNTMVLPDHKLALLQEYLSQTDPRGPTGIDPEESVLKCEEAMDVEQSLLPSGDQVYTGSFLAQLMSESGSSKSELVDYLQIHSEPRDPPSNLFEDIMAALNHLGVRFFEQLQQFDRKGLPNLTTLFVHVLFLHIELDGWNEVVSELLTNSPMNCSLYNKIVTRLQKFGLNVQSFLSSGEIIDDEDRPILEEMDVKIENDLFSIEGVLNDEIVLADQGRFFGGILSAGKLGDLVKFSRQLVLKLKNIDHQHVMNFLSEVLARVKRLDVAEFPPLPRIDYVLCHVLNECRQLNSLEPISRRFPILLDLIEFGGNFRLLKLCISEIPCQTYKRLLISRFYTAFPKIFPPFFEDFTEIGVNVPFKTADSVMRRLLVLLSVPETGLKAKNRMQKAAMICKKVGLSHPVLLLHYLGLLASILAGRGNFTFNELTSKHNYHLFAHVVGLLEFILDQRPKVSDVCDICTCFIVLIDTQLETKNPQGINGIMSIVVKLVSLMYKIYCMWPEESKSLANKALESFRNYANAVSGSQSISEGVRRLQSTISATDRGPRYLRVLEKREKMTKKRTNFPASLNPTERCYKKLLAKLVNLDDLSKRRLHVLDEFKPELISLYSNSTEEVRTISSRLIMRNLIINPDERYAREFFGQKVRHEIDNLNLPEMMIFCGDSSAQLVADLCDLCIRMSIPIDFGDMIRTLTLKFNC